MTAIVSDPIRVLHVYSGNLYGGVERLLATLASMRVEGMRQAFALSFEGQLAREIREAGAPLYLLGPVRISRPLSVRRGRQAMRDALRTEKPDVVVCHSTWPQALFGLVARARKVPLVFWLHDAVTGNTLTDRLARRVRPDFALCTSHFAAETLPRLWSGVPSRVVYYPVPPYQADPVGRAALRESLDTPPGDVVLLQASRMEPWKGQRVLVQALETIHQVGGWTCWMAGGAQRPHEEAYLAEMYALAQQLGIAHRIRFLGHRRDVRELMAAADVFCQANLGPEPFGIVFVEAMYAEIPVVAAALGGSREIIDPRCGVLVPPDDPAALGEALRELVLDATLRERLGAAGPAHAAELCDPARQGEAMREVLAEVAAGRAGAAAG